MNFNSGLSTPPTTREPCRRIARRSSPRREAPTKPPRRPRGYTGVQDYADFPVAPPDPFFYDPTARGRLGSRAGPPTRGSWTAPTALHHPAGPRRAELQGEGKPRRPRAGKRGRKRGLRGHRDKLHEGAGDDADAAGRRSGPAPRSQRALLPRLGADARPARSAAPARSPSRSTKRSWAPTSPRPRLRLRRPGPTHGLERLRLLLRLGPAADAGLPLHRARHQLRGRRQTAEGVASGSANGNIDDPQFQWLRTSSRAPRRTTSSS